MKHIKTMCLLLVLMQAFMLAASCSSDGGNGEVNETTAETTTAAETEVTEADYSPKVKDLDFEGAEFMVLYPQWGVYYKYFFKELDGDVINDAVYNRNAAVEEELNITINSHCPGNILQIHPTLKASVMAGDSTYDLALTHCADGVTAILSDKLVLDWNDIPYIDFDQPYWNGAMNDMLNNAGNLPFVGSSYLILDPNCVMYNIEMYKNYGFDNLYGIIDDGQWTWDKLTELAASASKDLDGNGEFDENDQYGFESARSWLYGSVPTSCDQYIMERDDDGVPQLAVNTEKMAGIIEKMFKLSYSDNASFMTPTLTNDNSTQIRFDTGRILFYLYPIRDIMEVYRQSEVDYGIVPFPKYDEAQEKYISLNWSGLMCVPITVEDTELVGAAIEYLSYYTHKDFMPVFYESLLSEKLARDEDSIRMLNIIYDNCVYDFGLNFSTGANKLFYTVEHMLKAKNTNLASFYAANETHVKAHYDNVYKMFEEM